MITVIYKPFEALRPVHIAVMAAAEAELSPSELPTIFGLPELVLQHACEDLVGWGLAGCINDRVRLLPGGSRCVAVWVATEQRGFWSFPDPDGWKLGKGVFFFRSPLSHLSDAGLDPESGSLLSQKEAADKQFALHYDTKEFERQIQSKAASRDLMACFKAGKDPRELIAGWLDRPRNRLHLNQVCREMSTALADGESGGADARKWVEHAFRCIDLQRKQAERRLRDEQRAYHLVQDVLIAVWLSNQTGLLREIAEAEPCSILVKSDFEAVWPTEKKRSAARLPQAPKTPGNAPKSQSASLLDELNRFISSWFK